MQWLRVVVPMLLASSTGIFLPQWLALDRRSRDELYSIKRMAKPSGKTLNPKQEVDELESTKRMPKPSTLNPRLKMAKLESIKRMPNS